MRLKEACFQDGSTYHNFEAIVKRFHRYIPQIDDESFETALQDVLEQRKIIQEDERYYPYDLYQSEIQISKSFKNGFMRLYMNMTSRKLIPLLQI